MRVGLAEIELVKRLLSLLDAQAMLVGIVEEEQRSQHGTFSHTLRAREMHIAIHRNLRIRDVGAVDKYDFIQVFHLRWLFESC